MIDRIHRFRPLSRRAFLPLLAASGLALSAFAADEYHVYFGTFTRGKDAMSKGIYLSRFDAATGMLSSPSLVAETASPSFLALHPSGKFLYTVAEVSDGGSVKAYAINAATGALTPLATRM